MINKKQQNTIIQNIIPFHPNSIGIFGSYARSENKPDSDLDILVSFDNEITLFDIIGIEQELSGKLGMKVDLITKKSLNKKIESFIYKDIKYIYQA